jgi:hypothetical protein
LSLEVIAKLGGIRPTDEQADSLDFFRQEYRPAVNRGGNQPRGVLLSYSFKIFFVV